MQYLSALLLVAMLGPSSLSFEYVHHEILVAVRIGGAGPFTFLLDTDTTPSAIDLVLARKLRLSLRGAAGSGTGVGAAHSRVIPVKISNVTVGAVSISSMNALALDLSGVGAGLGRHLDGVLGTSFLDGLVVQIDYSCRRISFLSGPVAPYAAHFSRGESGDNVSREVWVGSHRVSATFDTGDGGYSFVSGKGITDLGLASAARAGKTTIVRGYNGAAGTTSGVLNDVRIGSVRLGSIGTKFLPSDNGTVDLNIGNKTFEHFLVTFDYRRGLLSLAPRQPCR